VPRQRKQPALMSAARKLPGTPVALLAVAACAVSLAACGTPARPAAQVAPASQTPAGSAESQSRGSADAQSAAAAASPATAAPATPTASPSPAPTVSTPARPGTTVPGAANCPLFPANNVWNTDISKLPVNPRSAQWLASMDSGSTYLHPDFGPSGGYPYGIPFKIVTSAHKLVHLTFTYASDSNRGPYPFGSDTPIEGGKNAGGDRHAIMVNSQTCTLYELWNARYSASRPRAGSGAIWNLKSNKLRPAGWTSADAAGLPILPGLLTYGQVTKAVRTGKPITHAIRFTAQRTRSAYLWPARHEAGSGSSLRLPPMGARFRLKASYSIAKFCSNATPYCKDAKAVLTEMRHYGLILADNGSNWYFQGSAYPKWPSGLIELLKRIPARSFQAVSESCLKVSRNSGKATAKPGCPIG
jgi:hypothetical protein